VSTTTNEADSTLVVVIEVRAVESIGAPRGNRPELEAARRPSDRLSRGLREDLAQLLLYRVAVSRSTTLDCSDRVLGDVTDVKSRHAVMLALVLA